MDAISLIPDLIPLRDDLSLLPGPNDVDGSPTWTLLDPVRNRYFRLGDVTVELLARWQPGPPQPVLEALQKETGHHVTMNDLIGLLGFLQQNYLLCRNNVEDLESWRRHMALAKPPWYKQLLHNYLFFRVPMARPDRFLSATLPYVEGLFSKVWLYVLGLLLLPGLFLTMRQWDQFQTTFVQFISWEGALYFGVALSVIKMLHELAHGYAAKRCGCRVPTMGIAFLVMWPVLYTDAGDAWKLPDAGSRMVIAGAGIVVELALAVVALFMWNLLPDGALRSVAFVVATTTWITSLVFNLNPFMRFDGYFLLSDWLGLENLHSRSFALAQWWMRAKLLGWRRGPPEQLPVGLRNFLIPFAYGIWVYRLFLFLGLAYLVYIYFFKLLGIFLAGVEVGWFILKPLGRELAIWWKGRHEMRWSWGGGLILLLLVGLMGLAVVPWQSRIALPAVLQAARQTYIFAPIPAQIVRAHVDRRQAVQEGQSLFSLGSPDLEHQIRLQQQRRQLITLRLKRQAASAEARSQYHILLQNLAEVDATLKGLQDQQKRLEIRAPFEGVVTNLAPAIKAGRWVDEKRPLALVMDPRVLEVVAFISEEDVSRIEAGAKGRFYADDIQFPPIDSAVIHMAHIHTAALDIPYLASTQDGPLAVQADENGQLIPTHGIYRIRLAPNSVPQSPDQVLRGRVWVEGRPRSALHRIWQSVWAVLIRESGF
ncbi:MAG: HlyD family efflux transporter periplasmic adaptor subunit [Magnetococcales bacterium]|nr:HlyD family efflux transporter periplasmic adaptor subunit [Magnetococcales bacterium]